MTTSMMIMMMTGRVEDERESSEKTNIHNSYILMLSFNLKQLGDCLSFLFVLPLIEASEDRERSTQSDH